MINVFIFECSERFCFRVFLVLVYYFCIKYDICYGKNFNNNILGLIGRRFLFVFFIS